VLLVKQTYGRLNWELPGGAAEAGESPDETVLREEAGLDVAVLHLTGYYHDAEADFLHFVFLCEMRAGAAAPRPDLTEVSECRYWPPGALPRPISDFTIRRIKMPSLGSGSGYRAASGRACGWSREPQKGATQPSGAADGPRQPGCRSCV
jgi:8-oxo-dGTP diphosphatase